MENVYLEVDFENIARLASIKIWMRNVTLVVSV